jgi:hypothetical protein
MTLQNWKILSKPSQHTDSRGQADGSLTLPQRKGVKQRKKHPVNQHSENPTPKSMPGGLQSWSPEPEDNIQTQTATPHWGKSWLSSCLWKTEEKLVRLPNQLERLRQNLCLSKTPPRCWRSNTRTTKTGILLFLNLEVFVCVYLFVLFLACLCWFVHLSLLISLGFFVCLIVVVVLFC